MSIIDIPGDAPGVTFPGRRNSLSSLSNVAESMADVVHESVGIGLSNVSQFGEPN